MTVAGTYLYQKWDRRASPPVLIMWPSSGNLGWGFQQSNPVDSLERCCDPQNNSLINTLKFYLLSDPCFWLARLFDWSRWVAISSVPLRMESQLQFYRWGWKKVTKTWSWEMFFQGYIPSTSGDALSTSPKCRDFEVFDHPW
jgi:hypothetical protein